MPVPPRCRAAPDAFGRRVVPARRPTEPLGPKHCTTIWNGAEGAGSERTGPLLSRQKAAAEPLDVGVYVASPEKRQRLYRRTLTIVVLAQLLGGSGLAAGITVGALLAQDMLGTDSLAGLPTALYTLGAAGAALGVGRLSHRFGRRFGLGTGFLVGGLGAVGVVAAAVHQHIPLLFASLFIYGAGSATNLQTRYAGTDLAPAQGRGQAVSTAIVSTTAGALAGPLLAHTMGRFAASVGIPPLAGPFILAAAAFTAAGVVLAAFLRPDPLIVAKAIAAAEEEQKGTGEEERAEAIAQAVQARRGVAVGAAVMALTQLVMVAIMTMTPIHMKHHHHGLQAIGLVIGLHIAAMYLPSPVTGVLVDMVGRPAMVVAAGLTLLVSGVIAAWAPGDSTVLLTAALILLGVGWNFGLISGTALIIDSTHPATRAKTQGTVDVLIALAGASGGALSGVVAVHSGYEVLSLAGGALSLIVIPLVLWWRRGGSLS